MSGRGTIVAVGLVALVTPVVIGACASDGGAGAGVDPSCAFVKQAGLCEVDVSLDPREADAPDEATTMEVRWTWLGAGEVLPKVVRYHMSAAEAAWRRESWDELGKSRCVIEEPVAPCAAPRRIVFVEAEP